MGMGKKYFSAVKYVANKVASKFKKKKIAD